MEIVKIPAPLFELLETTPSTMDAARANVVSGRVTFDAEGAPSSWGVLTEEQTAGRGQRGRVWHAVRGESLCATYYIRHRFTLPEEAGRIPLMAGVAVASQVRRHLNDGRVGLKWPNDILIGGRKAGGILVEMVRAPDGQWVALVGIGVNVLVSEFPEELRGFATSLALETSAPDALPSPGELALVIGGALWSCAANHDPVSFAAWISQWRDMDATTGRRFATAWEGVAVTGTAEGINDQGALLLRLEDGTLATVTSASSLREIV